MLAGFTCLWVLLEGIGSILRHVQVQWFTLTFDCRDYAVSGIDAFDVRWLTAYAIVYRFSGFGDDLVLYAIFARCLCITVCGWRCLQELAFLYLWGWVGFYVLFGFMAVVSYFTVLWSFRWYGYYMMQGVLLVLILEMPGGLLYLVSLMIGSWDVIYVVRSEGMFGHCIRLDYLCVVCSCGLAVVGLFIPCFVTFDVVDLCFDLVGSNLFVLVLLLIVDWWNMQPYVYLLISVFGEVSWWGRLGFLGSKIMDYCTLQLCFYLVETCGLGCWFGLRIMSLGIDMHFIAQ
eukprot:gene2838-1823_t